MITVRPEREEDYETIFEVNRLAFGGNAEPQLIDSLRNSPTFIPSLSLVAEKEGRVVGHVVLSEIFVTTKTKKISALSLAPMAVLPEFQRQGIGTLLAKKGLRIAKKLGYTFVVVVGHPHFYARLGFVSAKEKGLKLPFESPEEAFMVYELVRGTLKDMDGIVEYPPAFLEVI